MPDSPAAVATSGGMPNLNATYYGGPEKEQRVSHNAVRNVLGGFRRRAGARVKTSKKKLREGGGHSRIKPKKKKEQLKE